MDGFNDDDLFGGFSESSNGNKSGFNAKRQRVDDSDGAPTKIQKKSTPSKPTLDPVSEMIKEQILDKPQAPRDEALFDTTVAPKKCVHDVCFPPGAGENPDPLTLEPPYPAKMARTWPFELDPFQRTAVGCIERKESVLVSAHTSAGKTVCAEYAIASALASGQKVVYTSPIKALSNQKYRELSEIFTDVGLMTGDITIQPNASCLVMTTEILRNMLYRGNELMREVSWVIFDEIHYMRDKDRGVVWEETIILLPDKVRYVFLSATIPNAREFAQWIAKLHNQVCHVVYTDYRPTPLQHYIFPAGGDGLHLVVDEKGIFREENFQKALASLVPTDNKRGSRKPSSGNSDIYKIVKMIMDREYQPVIVFSFSKRDCEGYALQMSKLDFNDEEEKKLVDSVFSNAIDSLSDDDKKLPQVESILPLLKRGIAIHHSGLLPILKEVIEILFQEGLIKALFATETFSIGLNMPAKTVVFTSVRKFDGESFRWISGGEYIQMSGRAGRRGLDERGIVIMMVDEKMEPAVAKGMVKGQTDPLNSSFRVGYNMLLNLLRVEDIDPESLLRKSFHQFQHDRTLPQLEQRLKELEAEQGQIKITEEEEVSEYYDIRVQLHKLKEGLREFINKPSHVLPFLQPGRLAKVTEGDSEWGWGVIVNFQKKREAKDQSLSDSNTKYIVDILLNCSPDSGDKPKPCLPGEQGVMKVVPVLLPLLDGLSAIRVYVPKDLRSQEGRQSVAKSIQEVQRRFEKDGIPLLDPVEDMEITDDKFKRLVRKIETLESRLFSNTLYKKGGQELQEKYSQYDRKMKLETEIKGLKKQLKSSGDTILKDDLKAMKRVLRRLGFTNNEDVVEVKGRVACEINAGDELVLTELMFQGLFNDMDIDHVVALMSCFAFDEKSDSASKMKEELLGPFRMVQEAARRVAKVSRECKLNVGDEEAVEQYKPQMMELVLAWAKGAKFSEIMKMTEIFEGSVIRSMRRLEELIRQLTVAARVIGNTELESKFSEGILKIKRDIVFAASLYL